MVDEAIVAREVRRHASFLVATNVLDPAQLADQELIQTYKEQRIVALSLVMVLCLLVYRLAEHRLREQLAATGRTVPNQLKQPTDRPTMRWIFQCFEGVSLVTFHSSHGPPRQDLANLEPLHEQVAALLGPSCERLYKVED